MVENVIPAAGAERGESGSPRSTHMPPRVGPTPHLVLGFIDRQIAFILRDSLSP